MYELGLQSLTQLKKGQKNRLKSELDMRVAFAKVFSKLGIHFVQYAGTHIAIDT
jgi:hypothetical protein